MKQIFKFFGVLLIAIILVVIGFFVYFHFGGTAQRSPLALIPDDAVIITESENISELMVELTHSAYWNSIIQGELFSEFNEGLKSFNDAVQENKLLAAVLQDQKVAVSMHQLSRFKSDFLYVVDIRKYGKLNPIPKIASAFKLPVRDHVVDSVRMYSVVVEELNKTIHLATIDNLLVGSLSYELLEKTIQNRFKNGGEQTIKNNEIYTVFEKRQFNVYVNIPGLTKALNKGDYGRYLKGLGFANLGGDFGSTSLILDGYSSCFDSVPSMFLPLLKAESGTRNADKVIPSGAVLYANFNVSDFDGFYDDFLLQYANLDAIGYSTYMSGIRLTESFLGINIKENVFSWMDGEIALAKLRPSDNSRELDFVVAIKANDIQKASTELDEIAKKIKNRTTVRFKKMDYKNYQINFLNVSGFFKIMMGNFFRNREKPYYTIVEDYVVFSNSSGLLMQVIDNYLVGNTLERNSSFKKFDEHLNSQAAITAYMNMHRLYEHLYYYSNKQERANLEKYRDLMQNIGLLGVQMYPDNNLIRTEVFAKQDTSEMLNIALEKLNLSAEELIIEDFDSLEFKVDLGDEFAAYNGSLDYYLTHPESVQDSVLVYEGELEEGVLQGMWKTYYTSGNIQSVVPYEDGLVNGSAIFYYDNKEHIIKAEIDFKDDIIEGEYKEFYTDGNVKARIAFKDGERWGDAFYYYQNGITKIEGQFKKGKRTGSWKYYANSGEFLRKERW